MKPYSAYLDKQTSQLKLQKSQKYLLEMKCGLIEPRETINNRKKKLFYVRALIDALLNN